MIQEGEGKERLSLTGGDFPLEQPDLTSWDPYLEWLGFEQDVLEDAERSAGERPGGREHGPLPHPEAPPGRLIMRAIM